MTKTEPGKPEVAVSAVLTVACSSLCSPNRFFARYESTDASSLDIKKSAASIHTTLALVFSSGGSPALDGAPPPGTPLPTRPPSDTPLPTRGAAIASSSAVPGAVLDLEVTADGQSSEVQKCKDVFTSSTSCGITARAHTYDKSQPATFSGTIGLGSFVFNVPSATSGEFVSGTLSKNSQIQVSRFN